jgi:methyl-accepting chemotaxis protein
MKIRTKSVLFGLVAVVVSISVTAVAIVMLMRGELTRLANVYQDAKMKVLHELLRSKGEPKIADGKLAFGTYVVNGDHEVVDKLAAIAGGTATIFQGDTRVSTNVMKDDGSRAVGTSLVGPAKSAAVDRALPYRGEADILGVPYFTAYDPIFDAERRPVGVLYVGVKQEDFLSSFNHLVLIVAGSAAAMAILFGLLIAFAANRVLDRVAVLARSAEAISVGEELDTPLASATQDEIGDLAKRIDRLRTSMRAALKRLDAQ